MQLATRCIVHVLQRRLLQLEQQRLSAIAATSSCALNSGNATQPPRSARLGAPLASWCDCICGSPIAASGAAATWAATAQRASPSSTTCVAQCRELATSSTFGVAQWRDVLMDGAPGRPARDPFATCSTRRRWSAKRRSPSTTARSGARSGPTLIPAPTHCAALLARSANWLA